MGRREARYHEGLRCVGWTYFIHAPEVGRIKIGRSNVDPAERLGDLRTGSPVELVGLAIIRGYDLETYLHEKFAPLKWGGEWFSADPLLMDFIREMTTPFAESSGVELYLPWDDAYELEASMYDKAVLWFEEREKNRPESERTAWRKHDVADGSHI